VGQVGGPVFDGTIAAPSSAQHQNPLHLIVERLADGAGGGSSQYAANIDRISRDSGMSPATHTRS
jgi:hypothetical protein